MANIGSQGLTQKQMECCHLVVFDGMTKYDAYARIYSKKSANNASVMFAKPHVREYMQSLRDDQARKAGISFTGNLIRLQDVIEEGLTGVDVFNKEGTKTGVRKELRTVVSAIAEQNKLLNLYDQKPKIDLPENVKDPIVFITSLMQSFAERKLDETDLNAMMRSLETLQTFQHGERLLQQLSELNLKSNNNLNIFNLPEGSVNEVPSISE